MPIEHINKTDTLNEGRVKLNAAIDGANAADVTSKAADTKATQALANSESTQTQLDTIVIDGDSSVEAAQARVDEKGVPHPTLKARIDDGLNSVNQQLAETDERIKRNAPLPIPINTYDGSGQATHPDVLYFENGWGGYKYWMAYTPYPFSDDSLENPSITYSNDGVNWHTTIIQNPIDQPTEEELMVGSYFSDPCLVMNGNVMECWYRFVDAQNGTSVGQRTEYFYRKTSSDGVNWSARETMYVFGPSDTIRYGLSPTVIYENGKYRMWFISGQQAVYYVESSNGVDWTSPQKIDVNWAEGEPATGLWHIDVTKDSDGTYHLISNTDPSPRSLVWAISSDGFEFNKCKTILEPSAKGWDDLNIYRASLLEKDNNTFAIYYSAVNKNSYWSIGLLEGERIDTLKGILPINMHGNLIISKALIKQEFNLSTEKLALKNANAYFSQDEIRFDTQGEKQVKLINTRDKTLQLEPAGSSWVGGVFRSHRIDSRKLEIDEAFSPGSFGMKLLGVINILKDDDRDIEPWIKMLNRGVGGAGFKIFNDNIVDVVRDNGSQGGHLRAGSVIFDGNSTTREGEIRYNKTTKKHQGYDGTTWHNLY